MLDRHYTYDGENLRVIIAGDVVSMPAIRWSGEGFEATVSLEWAITSAGLPSAGRERYARILVAALRDYYGVTR